MKKSALLMALALAAVSAGGCALGDSDDTSAQTTDTTVEQEATQDATAQQTDADAETQQNAQYQVLERGAEGEDVQALMQRLYDLGYYTSTVDDTFGRGMAKAVRLFNAQCGLGNSETATVEMQEMAFSADAPAYAVMPPKITNVKLEQYEGKPIFSIEAYNPQDSDITFLSIIFRCYDIDGNQIYATEADPSLLSSEPKFGKYRDIEIACGETVDLQTVTSFDLSAYEGVSKVEAAVYCYQAGRSIMIVPENYFVWVSSDGTTTGTEVSQATLELRNRTTEQDKLVTKFDFGMTGEHVFSYESEYYGVPVGLYLTNVEEGSIAANAGLQVGDVITSIAGIPLDFDEAFYIIKAQMEQGVEYTLEYSRAGQTLSTTVSWTEAAEE